MNNLSNRLKTISSLVDAQVIADVGCDHGKMADYLLSRGLIQFAYVSDISEASLSKAKTLLSKYGNKYKSICCDGLLGYRGYNVDECIISGMGGDEIIKIISASPIDIPVYILSPQHNEIAVKKYMLDNNYQIVYDIIIKDRHKYYNVVKYEKLVGKKSIKIDDFDLYFGKDNFTNNIDFTNYLDYEINKTQNILMQIKDESKSGEFKKYLKLLKLAKGRIDWYEKTIGISGAGYWTSKSQKK